MSILTVQPSSKCDATCLVCPWREKFGCVGVMLPLEALEVLTENLGDFKFDEGIITCPNPLLHPKIDFIVNEIRDLCKKTTIFLPASVSKNALHKAPLKNVDVVSFLISTFRDIRSNVQTLKMLLSQGIDNIEAYVPLDSSYDFAEILSIIKVCSSYGLKITIGPYMCNRLYIYKFLEKLSKRENVEIGLHYGRRYFYNAIKVFINNYPVDVLTSPIGENCRALYLNPYGNFSKCPFLNYEVNYKKITRDELRKMLFSPCTINHNPMHLSPRISVSFVTRDGVEVSSDVLELLELIYQLNSFRAACRALGVSPSTYWEKIRSLEEKLGITLLISMKGGKKKGVTLLTDFAKELLEKYKEIREKALVSMYEY
ncbi:winged helix-turn-helix domain-containing protein [Palaeococcus sp. (in: euryarchaeotes)]